MEDLIIVFNPHTDKFGTTPKSLDNDNASERYIVGLLPLTPGAQGALHGERHTVLFLFGRNKYNLAAYPFQRGADWTHLAFDYFDEKMGAPLGNDDEAMQAAYPILAHLLGRTTDADVTPPTRLLGWPDTWADGLAPMVDYWGRVDFANRIMAKFGASGTEVIRG